MNPWITWLKVGLVRLAVALAAVGESPIWRVARPVETFRRISRDRERAYTIDLEGGSHSNAYLVLESYLAAAEKVLDLDQEDQHLIQVSRELLTQLEQRLPGPERKIDWVAKQQLIESALDARDTPRASTLPTAIWTKKRVCSRPWRSLERWIRFRLSRLGPKGARVREPSR